MKNEQFTGRKSYFLYVFLCFPLFMPKSKSLLSLFAPSFFFKERWERFAQVDLYKRATLSKLLLLLFTKERPWAIRYFWEQIALLHTKTSNSLKKPKSEFPTLLFSIHIFTPYRCIRPCQGLHSKLFNKVLYNFAKCSDVRKGPGQTLFYPFLLLVLRTRKKSCQSKQFISFLLGFLNF